MDSNGPLIVVLGVDSESKPHASWFPEGLAASAARAAQLMGLHAVRVEEESLRRAAAGLPAGRIFATGRGLVPFVKRELYDKLAGLIGTAAELKPEDAAEVAAIGETVAGGERQASTAVSDEPEQEPDGNSAGEQVLEAKAETADLWAGIAVGSIVLAASPNDGEGWFEAVITGVSDGGDTLFMRWRDYPGVPLASTHRHKVGLIGPGAQ